jgi:hypothetical protein
MGRGSLGADPSRCLSSGSATDCVTGPRHAHSSGSLPLCPCACAWRHARELLSKVVRDDGARLGGREGGKRGLRRGATGEGGGETHVVSRVAADLEVRPSRRREWGRGSGDLPPGGEHITTIKDGDSRADI